jgi:hypothetical protein
VTTAALLDWSLLLLWLAVVLGVGLIVVAMHWPRLRWPGWVHGGMGVAGFALLLAGQGGPPRGVAQGAQSFGMVSAVFIALTVAFGAWIFTARVRRRAPSMLAVGVHASLAVGGAIMLAAYVTAG